VDTRGFAFSGDLFYPTVVGQAVWIDSRTCSLPVALAALDRQKFPGYVGIGTWSADMRQLTFPARIEGQKEYVIGLNSAEDIKFQNDHGVPLDPVKWVFDTMR